MRLTTLTSVLVSLILYSVNGATLFDHTAATQLPLIDDFAHTVALTMPIIFNGASYTSLYVSDNGMVTFSNAFIGRTWPLEIPWIAPYGADISSGELKVQEYGTDSDSIIEDANAIVNEIYPDDGFVATHVVVVTWFEVAKSTLQPEVNTFQLVIPTDGSTKSYALFLYEKIDWYPAQAVGVSSGVPAMYYLVCDTDKPITLFLPKKSNSQCSSTPGLVVLRIHQIPSSRAFSCINLYAPINCPTTPGNTNRHKRCSTK